MAERIRRQANALRDQLSQAITAATALGLGWPASAPTIAAMTAARDNISTSITDTDAKEDAWKVAGQLKGTRVNTGINIMKAVDEATDLLHGPGGAEKNNYGLPPKGAAIEPLHQLIVTLLDDGPVSGSFRYDWESIEGAAYEVNWSTVSNFATIVGSATTSSASEYIIGGLTPGVQYWARVRPIRGSESAPWSDPATRVAPI